MWRTVFPNNRIQRSSSSMDLINEKSLNYSLENHIKLNCDNEQQQQCKIKNFSSFRLKNRKQFEKQFDKQQLAKNQQQQKQQLEHDLTTLESKLIESKKKLASKLNIKFRQQTTSNEKIKRRIYEQFECAVLLNDCTKLAILLKDNPKLNLSYYLRPDQNTFLHTAVRYKCKDALSWLASRCSRSQLNQQNHLGETCLHLAVREESPILVNILLNHKACNHVQNYMNRETPLSLALNLYIKYRNLKDYDGIANRNLEQFGSAQLTNGRTASLQGNFTTDHHLSSIKINSCFCQKGAKSLDLLQLEANNIDAAKLQQHQSQNGKENDSNSNRLISKSTVRNYNFANRTHLNKLDDLTAAFLNKQNLIRNCCTLSSNNNTESGSIRQLSPNNRSENDTINNCRLMRKIVMAILHDSDFNSWQIPNSKGQSVVAIAKEHQVDFVYDFICNYQTLLMRPDRFHLIDQNGNYLSTAFDTQIKNCNLFNKITQIASESLNTSSDRASSDASSTATNSTTLIEANSGVQNGASFFSTSSSYTNNNINNSSNNNNSNNNNNTKCISKVAVNHYKRKTDDDDDEQQYCLREQRSIIKQDNFNKSSIRNAAPANSINRLYFRKSNRSHSITLPNIKLSERDHNLFTSSCSLNRLNELENRKHFDHSQHSNNLDHQLKIVGSLLESQERQLKFNHIDQQSSHDHSRSEQSDHLDQNRIEFEYPVKYSNIPNDFAKQQQQQQQSIQCSDTNTVLVTRTVTKQRQPTTTLINQTNVKTALVVFQ